MRTGRLSRLGHQARDTQVDRSPRSAPRRTGSYLELIAHAWNLVLHSLHCTDKCPVGRSSPWPHLNLAPTALPSLLYQRDGRFDGHPGNVG